VELILLIVLILVLFGGGFGHYRGAGWGAPVGGLGFILLIVVIYLIFSGRL
jgi:hypothetical protein